MKKKKKRGGIIKMCMLYSEIMPEQLEALEKSGKYCSQDKVDGDNFKVICKNVKFANGSKRIIQLINRHDNNYTRQFPEIVAGIGVSSDVDCAINGEIAYWNEEKQIYDFNILRSRQGLQKDRDIMKRRLKYPSKFYAFDLISYNGESMVNNPHFPFRKRYNLLKMIVRNNNATELLPIRKDLVTHFKEECEAGREGVMIKSLDNIYIDGRTKSILKCKNWHYELVRFNGFDINKGGSITLTNGEDRVLCASREHIDTIRATIIQQGYSDEVVRHLQERTDNNALREPSWKPKEKYLECVK